MGFVQRDNLIAPRCVHVFTIPREFLAAGVYVLLFWHSFAITSLHFPVHSLFSISCLVFTELFCFHGVGLHILGRIPLSLFWFVGWLGYMSSIFRGLHIPLGHYAFQLNVSGPV